MSFVHPHAVFEVREVPGGLVIDLPSPRRPLTALLVGAWLACWSVGLAFVVQQVRTAPTSTADRAFLFAWAAVWALAGVAALMWLAWLMAGRERVTLGEHGLAIWRGVGVVGVVRAYPAAHVHDLRTFGREVVPLLAASLDFTGQGASGIRFMCDERVVRFARALDEPAAHALVARLRSSPPFDRNPGAPVRPAA